MKYWYDTEFLEDGRTIELISIGIVAEDGREYYAANYHMPIGRIREDGWLMANVTPHLPPMSEWKTPDTIAAEVRDFILTGGEPELWADYAAYDHVALCQLFGRMIDLPDGMPMFTNDIRQLIGFTGVSDLPEQDGGEHDALADARHGRVIYEHILSEAGEGEPR